MRSVLSFSVCAAVRSEVIFRSTKDFNMAMRFSLGHGYANLVSVFAGSMEPGCETTTRMLYHAIRSIWIGVLLLGLFYTIQTLIRHNSWLFSKSQEFLPSAPPKSLSKTSEGLATPRTDIFTVASITSVTLLDTRCA